MLIRQPELRFVDIAEYEILGGTAAEPSIVNRITASHPPTPEEAAVDDLHRLPRGDPECRAAERRRRRPNPEELKPTPPTG